MNFKWYCGVQIIFKVDSRRVCWLVMWPTFVVEACHCVTYLALSVALSLSISRSSIYQSTNQAKSRPDSGLQNSIDSTNAGRENGWNFAGENINICTWNDDNLLSYKKSTVSTWYYIDSIKWACQNRCWIDNSCYKEKNHWNIRYSACI